MNFLIPLNENFVFWDQYILTFFVMCCELNFISPVMIYFMQYHLCIENNSLTVHEMSTLKEIVIELMLLLLIINIMFSKLSIIHILAEVPSFVQVSNILKRFFVLLHLNEFSSYFSFFTCDYMYNFFLILKTEVELIKYWKKTYLSIYTF